MNIDIDYIESDDFFEWKPLNKVKAGDFIKRKPDAKKVFTKNTTIVKTKHSPVLILMISVDAYF